MKKINVNLVLATWADVEPGDVVWLEDELYRVVSEPYKDPNDLRWRSDDESPMTWDIEPVDANPYTDTTRKIYRRLHRHVPVVVT